MERVMSVEDKIRRAEEIYYKRRQQEVPMREMMRKTPTKKNDIRLIKKMIKQIIVCMIIYGIFYLIVNSNYIFSEDFTNKVKEILSQDINFSQVYSVVSNRINEIYKQTIKEESQNEENEEQNKDILLMEGN